MTRLSSLFFLNSESRKIHFFLILGTPYGERLLKAAEKGCTVLVKEILSEHRDIINYKDSDGYTPLHRACYQGWEDIVEILLEYGAFPYYYCGI